MSALTIKAVAEVLSLVATLGLVWLSLFLLKKKETLGVGARISSGFQSKKEKSKRKESTNGTQSERTGMKYFTERSKKKTTDIEQAHPPNPS